MVIISIDLKSFYASAEAVDRGYDPLTTNLVVADASRTEKTICLAVSPSLKAHGISGRARLFEVVQRVKEVNAERFRKAMALGILPKDDDGRYHFTSSSFDAQALEADPSLELSYIIAPPRMKLYEEISTRIFGIYSKYVSPDDIHVYSIDEVFLDVTGYLNTYRMTAHELAITMIREVLYETGIKDGGMPTVSITYFIPDPLKAGGRYETTVEQIRKIDAIRGKVILARTQGYGNMNVEIDMKDILNLASRFTSRLGLRL